MTDASKFPPLNLHQQNVYAEQVRLIYKPIFLSVIGTFVGALLFVAVQWNVVNHNVQLLWLFAMILLLVFHSLLAYQYFRKAPDIEEARRWGQYYVYSTAASGIMWGIASILFFPEGHFEQQITVAFAMVLISAGGVITISFIRAAAYVLIIPAMLPMIPLFLLEETYLATMFALIIFVMFVFLLFSANYIYSSSHENIGLRLAAIENENSLRQANQLAQKASKAKSEFISSMSHELRTPMNVILGYAQLLEYHNEDDEEQANSVNEILKAGYHLLNLINEVLDLSSIESGHISLHIEPVSVDDLLVGCLSLVAPLAKKRGISIHPAKVDSQFVLADITRIKQVILNLLSNAVKYNRENGEINIEVSHLKEKTIRITISDTGYGIDNDKFEELFQPFHRLNNKNHTIEGTGIGLTITRNLVEIMNGSIGVESEKGVGSRFWIELPLDTEHTT